MLHPLLSGVLATALAAFQIFGWLAIGSVWPRLPEDDDAAPAVALIAGSAFTALIYAGTSAAGWARAGVVLCAALTPIVGFIRRKQAGALVKRVAQAHTWLWGRDRLPLFIGIAVLALAWLTAISPPRDSDVMRYHLAHLRQILDENVWVAIPDFHYALPFAWTMNFLPFEAAGLPEAAHLVNLCAWLTVVALVATSLRERVSTPVLRVFCLVLTCQPVLFKMITTAHADAYAMLVVLVTAVLLSRQSQPTGDKTAEALGFVGWAGIGSRYQLIASGLVASALFLTSTARHRKLAVRGGAFAGGMVAAIAAALPFYVMNLAAFDNPVWPMLSELLGTNGYADHVATAHHASLSGPSSLSALSSAVARLVSSPLVFPVPIVALAVILAMPFTRNSQARASATFLLCFLLVWAVAQPSLYPRFILMLTPVVLMGAAALSSDAFERLRDKWWRTMMRAAALAAVLVALTIATWYSADALHYSVTGDRTRFDRHTNFLPMYRWINEKTPADARFLVVIFLGQTYHLDRAYRRADPATSAVIDWPSISDGKALHGVLRQQGFTHLVYEAREWKYWPGGRQAQRAIEDGLARALLVRDTTFHLENSARRILGETYRSEVWLMRVTP